MEEMKKVELEFITDWIDTAVWMGEPVGTSAEPLTLEMVKKGISLLREHSSFDAEAIPEKAGDCPTNSYRYKFAEKVTIKGKTYKVARGRLGKISLIDDETGFPVGGEMTEETLYTLLMLGPISSVEIITEAKTEAKTEDDFYAKFW